MLSKALDVPREPGDPLGQSGYALGACVGCVVGLGLAVWRLVAKDGGISKMPADNSRRFQFSLRLIFGWTALFALYLAWPVPPKDTGVRDELLMLAYLVLGGALGRLAGGIVNETTGRVIAMVTGTLTALRILLAEVEKVPDIRADQLIMVLFFGILGAVAFEPGLLIVRACRSLRFHWNSSKGQGMTKLSERIEWLIMLGGPILAMGNLAVAYTYRGAPGVPIVAVTGVASGVLLFAVGMVIFRLRQTLAACEQRIAKLEREFRPSEIRMQ